MIDSAEVITFRFVTRAVDVLREMQMKERAEPYNAITGTGYYSLWQSGC